MPCDSIVLNKVDLEVAGKNLDLLERALKEEFDGYLDHNLGADASAAKWFRFYADGKTVTFSNGKLQSSMSAAELGVVVGRVQQAYGRQVVGEAAKRFGWVVKKGANKNKFQVVKRG